MNINELLKELVQKKGSNLHLKVGNNPYIRLDGVLTPLEKYPKILPKDVETAARTIMTDEQWEKFQQRKSFDFTYSAFGIGRFRVNAFHQRGTLGMVFLRVLLEVPPFEELGLPDILKKLALEYRGLIIVTGPTGSGKTTTLAAMVDHINTHRRCHVLTIEDPIEILYKDKMSIISQREVEIDADSFIDALRYSLREDPDVILIGEMRDEHTVRAALLAAETGHLVMTTLHTMGAVESINRIVNFFQPHEQPQVRVALADAIRGVISQRLVRRKGGGRIPAVESMVMTGRIRDLIIDNEKTYQIADIIAEGGYYGMQTFDQSLLKLFRDGLITLEDCLATATNPHDLKLAIQRVGVDIKRIQKDESAQVE